LAGVVEYNVGSQVLSLLREAVSALIRNLTAVCTVGVVLLSPATATAQKREFTDKPLLRAWFKLDEREVSDYMQAVLKDYEVESPLATAIKRGAMDTSARPELQGMLVLLAKGLVPMPVQLQFVSVKDEKEFHRLILRAKNQLGSTATMSGNGDHYTMDLDFSKGIPMFGTADAEEPELFEFPGMAKLRNNPAMLARLKRTIHFRLIDNVMWQGEVPEIMEMNLPSFAELQPSENPDSFDVLAEFNLQDVPYYLKSLLFNTVNMATKTQLQQRDDEEQLKYDVRRANGDFWLELLRTVVYDVDKGKISIRFARDEKPIRIRLNLDARANSNLEKVGKLLDSGQSRVAAGRNRPAPMTISSTFGLPGQMKKLFVTSFALAKREFDTEYKDNQDAMSAVDELNVLVLKTIDAGQADLLLQMAGDVETGFALVGGIRIEDADDFRDGLDRLLSSLKETNRIERNVDEFGRHFVSLETGDLPVPGSGTDEYFTSGMHFTAYDSCLWFAFGGPSAKELLTELIRYSEENRGSQRRSSEPFQFGFDLSQWLAGDDDADGFNQLPRQALLNAERKLDAAVARIFSKAGGALEVFDERSGKQAERDGTIAGDIELDPDDRLLSGAPIRSSMLLKALKQGGDEVDLRIKLSGEGIDVDLDIGLGIANMLVARMADFQGRAMEMLMQKPAKQTLDRPVDAVEVE
jgi:hypothetical protein